MRPEVIYLIQASERWEILKPGLIFWAAGIDQPFHAESDWYPPGDPSTIDGPAQLQAAKVACPNGRASISDSTDPVTDQNGDSVAAPWLQIQRLHVGRLSDGRICFVLTLAGPPRPDSSFTIAFGLRSQDAAGDLYDVEIDGRGGVHVLLAGQGFFSEPWLGRYLPRVGVVGTSLELVAPRIPWPHRTWPRSFLVVSASQSLQPTEPLLTQRLDATQNFPRRGCLKFPRGGFDFRGLCGSVPGP